METLSTSPRLFRLHNFINHDDVDELISLTGKANLESSTTGLQQEGKTGENQGEITESRTSKNAWDQDSHLAIKMKKRVFSALRIPFNTTWADGLQLVHYDPGQYYLEHTDYFDIHSDPNWDFNPETGGVNRFATVFLYLSDVELGGETVFPEAGEGTPHGDQEEVRRLKQELFPNNPGAADLVDRCQSKKGVLPRKGDAVLFYHQSRSGKLDPAALHGACPVLKGEKWGANVWVWNGKSF